MSLGERPIGWWSGFGRPQRDVDLGSPSASDDLIDEGVEIFRLVDEVDVVGVVEGVNVWIRGDGLLLSCQMVTLLVLQVSKRAGQVKVAIHSAVGDGAPCHHGQLAVSQ